MNQRTLLLCAISFLLATFAASSTMAQQVVEAAPSSSSAPPVDGNPSSSKSLVGVPRFSISLGIPGGGNPYASGAVGGWYLLQKNINFGFNFGLSLSTQPGTGTGNDAKTHVSYSLLFGPALKYYLATSSSISPFVISQLNFAVTSQTGQPEASIGLSLIGGGGMEWFLTPQFSLSGYLGMAFDIVRPQKGFGMGTFTSSLAANFYF